VSDIPESVQALLRQRQEARATKDFARADALRDEIAAAGYALKDTPHGAVAERAQRFEALDPASIENDLDNPAVLELSIHLLYEGFMSDVERFLAGLRAHNDLASAEVILVDNASPDGDMLEDLDGLKVVHLDREVGWASARNAGIKISKGELIVLVDLSIEPVGDILSPLRSAFIDGSIGVVGPFGLRSESMREWHEAEGNVDAIEGYLLATRRALLARGLIHEKFKWYRNADIDLSFQLRSGGTRAITLPLPVTKHEHRGWTALDEAERSKRSKRNHYLFFDRWKDRPDLLLANSEPTDA